MEQHNEWEYMFWDYSKGLSFLEERYPSFVDAWKAFSLHVSRGMHPDLKLSHLAKRISALTDIPLVCPCSIGLKVKHDLPKHVHVVVNSARYG
jgi:hypothetical protein